MEAAPRISTAGTDNATLLESGRAFLDKSLALFDGGGPMQYSLDVLFAGLRVLNVAMSAETWQAFLAICDDHPVNDYLYGSTSQAEALPARAIVRPTAAASRKSHVL